MKKIFLILFIIFAYNLCISQSYLTGYGKVFPIDGNYEKTFEIFLDKLDIAIKNYDKNYIYSIISPNCDFGHIESNGLTGFKLLYNLSDSSCDFWKIDKRVLSWGGEKNRYNDDYHFPNSKLWEFFDENFKNIEIRMYNSKNGDYDFYGIAIGNHVSVYSKPDENSETMGYLNYEVVRIVNYYNNEWNKIQLLNNNIGYVKKNDIYEEIGDYCIEFKKIKGKWKISLFSPTDI